MKNLKRNIGYSWLLIVAMGFIIGFMVLIVQQYGWLTLFGVGLLLSFLTSVVAAVLFIGAEYDEP